MCNEKLLAGFYMIGILTENFAKQLVNISDQAPIEMLFEGLGKSRLNVQNKIFSKLKY